MKLVYLKEKDKNILNDYVRSQPNSSLSQTFAWGEVQKAAGFKVWRLGVMDAGKLVSAVTVLKYDMMRSRFWYLYTPRYLPVGHDLIQKEIEKIAAQEKCIFWRFDPLVAEKKWQTFGEVPALKQIQPQDTIIVSLKESEDEILQKMKSKWRYNIRLAKRKGVMVRSSTDPKDLDKFYEIAEVTAQRDGFHIHDKKYYEAMLQNLAPGGYMRVFLAEYEGKVLAANLISFYKNQTTYLHGASTNENRNLMAPHLLQWEAMLYAKQNGCTEYDLYGVAPEGDKNHPWSGVTRFKEGFGGDRVHYIGAFDKVYKNFNYSLLRFLSKIKK